MVGIKDMEMPTRCEECKFCIRQKTNDYGSYGQCMAGGCETVNTLYLSPGCPLVEIITCKDCKYYREDDDTGYCTNHTCGDITFWCRDDYYCADAERRENETN